MNNYEEEEVTDYEEMSDCCGAEIIRGDLCSDCLEHCEPHEWEDDDLTPEQMNDELRSIGF